jgi:hypothetical protein
MIFSPWISMGRESLFLVVGPSELIVAALSNPPDEFAAFVTPSLSQPDPQLETVALPPPDELHNDRESVADSLSFGTVISGLINSFDSLTVNSSREFTGRV